jgi:hypothetical protein
MTSLDAVLRALNTGLYESASQVRAALAEAAAFRRGGEVDLGRG